MKNLFEIIAESDWNKQFELEKKLLEHSDKMIVFPKKFRLTPKTVLKLVEQGNQLVITPYFDYELIYVCEKEWKPIKLGLTLELEKQFDAKIHNGWSYSYLVSKEAPFLSIKGITVV